MKYFRRVGLMLAAGLLISSTVLTVLHATAQTITDNYTSHLIDDPVMRNYSAMSAFDIQGFLQTKGSGLASVNSIEDCGSPSGSHYAFYASYYSCGATASAAKIIWDSSQAYGINPQVVLATIQKEQSLVTTPNPTVSQLDYAMGYGCPDGGGCSHQGFFNQIDNGTWQFRVDMELSSGNNYWGMTPANYACNGATRYRSASMIAGNNVTFFDDDGTAYNQFVIPNAATATLYCYTPHVYNNPQGLYGLPQYGTTGNYYTGSYNFVYYFTLWFGGTYADAYSATFVAQSPYPTAYIGEPTPVYVMYRNTGNSSWFDDRSVPKGTNPIHLATSNAINRSSSFSNGWPSAGRPAVNFAAVYNSDGTTLSGNQDVVQPGQVAKYQFNLTAPWNIAVGNYAEYFQPILDGATTGWSMGGQIWFNVNVDSRYKAAFYSQSSPSTLTIQQNSQSIPSFIRYKNTGSAAWYDDTSVVSGYRPTHLATSGPLNRWSGFGSSWPSRSRPTLVLSAVYQGDGVTHTSGSPHVVMPGQIGEYSFTMTAPASIPDGSYREYFQPIMEGSFQPFMGGVSWFDMNVQSTSSAAQFYTQSAFPTLNQGQSGTVFIEYKNVGNVNWYDDSGIPAGSGFSPVHLATTAPINRSSVFSNSWLNAARPATTFAAVYQSNGILPGTAGQHVVQPGEIAKFQFTVTAPWNITPGVHREYFQPVLENAAKGYWNIGGVSWIDVTTN